MKAEELAEIKERADKATEGPWDADIYTIYSENDRDVAEVVGVNQFENMHFIAHAREDVPKLVAEVERLRKHIESALFYVENDGNFRDIYDELKEALE